MNGLRLLRPAHRSSSGAHDLLPANHSPGTIIVFFAPISTLFGWTFGGGTVIWRIWPAVLLHALFATVVTAVSLRTDLDLGVSNVMLTVLGVVIGFVISYRASCGYDQYMTGRSAWSDVVRHTRTLTRLIWFHVPLRLTPKTAAELTKPVAPPRSKEEMETVMAEKRAAVDLLEGFAVSLKHHLRGELGIFYEDLYHLVKPLHEKNLHHADDSTVRDSPSTLTLDQHQPWQSRGKSEHDPLIPPITAYGSIISESISRAASSSSHAVSVLLRPASHDHSPSLLNRVSADLIPFSAYLRGIFSFYRSSEVSDIQSGIDIDCRGGIQRRSTTGVPVCGPKVHKRVARGDENIPADVLRLLSDWFAVLEERGTVPGTSLGTIIFTVTELENALSAAERVLTTPIPFVYTVHIRTVWLYLFFLPFQLVTQFSWYTIPGVAMAAFIYLGFLAAGDEIAQPFGYDENDLDLDLICREIIQADLSHLKETPGINVYLGPHEAMPQDA